MAKATRKTKKKKRSYYILYIISSCYIEFAHVKQPTSTPNDMHIAAPPNATSSLALFAIATAHSNIFSCNQIIYTARKMVWFHIGIASARYSYSVTHSQLLLPVIFMKKRRKRKRRSMKKKTWKWNKRKIPAYTSNRESPKNEDGNEKFDIVSNRRHRHRNRRRTVWKRTQYIALNRSSPAHQHTEQKAIFSAFRLTLVHRSNSQ